MTPPPHQSIHVLHTPVAAESGRVLRIKQITLLIVVPIVSVAIAAAAVFYAVVIAHWRRSPAGERRRGHPLLRHHCHGYGEELDFAAGDIHG